MIRRFSVNFALLSMVIDMSLVDIALYFTVKIRPFLTDLPFITLVSNDQLIIHRGLFVIVPILWIFIFVIASVYDPKRSYKIVDELQNVVTASGITALVLAGVLYLFFREFSRWIFVLSVLFSTILLLSWRILLRFVFRVRRFSAKTRKVLIIGAGKIGQRVGDMIGEYNWTGGVQLVGYLDDNPNKKKMMFSILGYVEDVIDVVDAYGVDDVVIALPWHAYGKVNHLALILHDLPVHVRVVPDYFSLALHRASMEDFGGIPMINLRDPALNDVQRLVKRMFDLVVSLFLLIFVLPIILLISLLVRLDSPGAVIFRQRRIGENGRLFGMFKFRTMIEGAEKMQDEFNELNEDGKIIFKRPDDPRITRIGRFLRRTSLDELPQLFNVILGEMSLVGPRPELPWMVDQYEPWQRKRFAVPQGMTGWWQVNGRSDNPMHLHTDDDIYYVQNYSIWMDIYILLKTPWIVLRGKGAY